MKILKLYTDGKNILHLSSIEGLEGLTELTAEQTARFEANPNSPVYEILNGKIEVPVIELTSEQKKAQAYSEPAIEWQGEFLNFDTALLRLTKYEVLQDARYSELLEKVKERKTLIDQIV